MSGAIHLHGVKVLYIYTSLSQAISQDENQPRKKRETGRKWYGLDSHLDLSETTPYIRANIRPCLSALRLRLLQPNPANSY